MERRGEEVHLDTTEASGGITRQGVRYVLAISLTLAIVLLSLIWITGALNTAPSAKQPVTAEQHALGG